MPAIALEAEAFRIWRLANPDKKVPALLAAGADYVSWKAARARMSERSLRLCVDSRSLRIVCQKLCGRWFGGPRPGEITPSAAVDRLIVTCRGRFNCDGVLKLSHASRTLDVISTRQECPDVGRPAPLDHRQR